MSPLYKWQGKILSVIEDGQRKLAAGINCCCGVIGECPCSEKSYPVEWRIMAGDFIFNQGPADDAILREFPLNNWLPDMYPNPNKLLELSLPTRLEVDCDCGITVTLESWITNIKLCDGEALRYPGHDFEEPPLNRVFICETGQEVENDNFADPNWQPPDPPDPNCPDPVICCVILDYEQEEKEEEYTDTFIGDQNPLGDWEWSNLLNWEPNSLSVPGLKFILPDDTRDVTVVNNLANNALNNEPVVKNLTVDAIGTVGSINIPITVLEDANFKNGGNIDQNNVCLFAQPGFVTTKNAKFTEDCFNRGTLSSTNGVVIFEDDSECKNGSLVELRGSDIYFKNNSVVANGAVIKVVAGPVNIYFQDNAVLEGTIQENGGIPFNVYFSDNAKMNSGKILGAGANTLVEFRNNSSVINNSIIEVRDIRFKDDSSANNNSILDGNTIVFSGNSSQNDNVTSAENTFFIQKASSNDNACWNGTVTWGGTGPDNIPVAFDDKPINNSTCSSNLLRFAEFKSKSENRGSLSIEGADGIIAVIEEASNFGTLSATIGAELVFLGEAVNEDGAVARGNVKFDETSLNEGEVTSVNNQLINFAGDAINETTGNVTGNALFKDRSINRGNVTGTPTFEDGACNDGGTAGVFVPDPPPAC
jgi:hypothetical protein